MKKLTSKKQLILYGCSGLGVNMLNLILGTRLCNAFLVGGFAEDVEFLTYMNKNLVVAALWGIMIFLAKALDGFIDLPFAFLTDRINNKFGRRKTGLLIGFIPMVISYLLFLIPLNDSATVLNTIWFGVLLCIFYSFYTLTMLTFYATFSEVCENEKDSMFLSNVKSICDVIYFSLGYALIPVFIGFGVNIRIVALIFLPLSLTMMIPMFLLKEKKKETNEDVPKDALSIKEAFNFSFKNKTFLYWMSTLFVMTIGLQLFLGAPGELFSSSGLNPTVVMASAFAPVPLTIIVYNKVVKKFGLGVAYKYILSVFSVGMVVMFLCCIYGNKFTSIQSTIIGILGGVFVSFAIGAFFSITYSVPTHLAQQEFKKTGKSTAAMYFAVQGIFEGVAAGIGTGLILQNLKETNNIPLLPIIIIICCMIAFAMSFGFAKEIKNMGKDKVEE